MDKNLMLLIVYPLLFILVILIINTKIWISKVIEANLNTQEKSKIITIFILLCALMNPEIVYGFVVYNLIEQADSFNQNIIFIFSSLIFATLAFKGIIMYKFINYVTRNIQNIQKAIPYTILGNAIAETPAIIGLIIVMQKLGS